MAYQLITGEILRIVISGRLTASDWANAMNELDRADAGSPRARDQLIDLMAVTHDDLTGADIERLSFMRPSHRPQNPVRLAIVASRLLEYGMARMFQTLNKQQNLHISVFHTLEEAQAWLGTPATAGQSRRNNDATTIFYEPNTTPRFS